MTMADAFLRKSRRFTRNLLGIPLGLLASLVGLTAAAWALTLYQAFSMDMPMGIAVRGGMEGMEGMAGMAMAGIAAKASSATPVSIENFRIRCLQRECCGGERARFTP